jgi:hypothetical protein
MAAVLLADDPLHRLIGRAARALIGEDADARSG